MKKLLLKNVWQTLAAVVFLIAVWFVAYLAVGNELLIPDFKDSLKEFVKLFVSAWFWQSWAMTMLRALAAFAISFAAALALAVLAYMCPAVGSFLAPIVSALRSLPVLAVLLIFLAFLNAGVAPIAVAFLSLFPMLYTGILAALSGLDRHLIEVSRVYGTPSSYFVGFGHSRFALDLALRVTGSRGRAVLCFETDRVRGSSFADGKEPRRYDAEREGVRGIAAVVCARWRFLYRGACIGARAEYACLAGGKEEFLKKENRNLRKSIVNGEKL